MRKDRRLVEEFIYRDNEQTQPPITASLSSLVLPEAELRYYIDPEEVEKIAASARKNGIVEPLLVRPIPQSERYEIVAGAKRYRAAQQLGLMEVPVVVRELNDEDALEIALIENLARSGLTDLEEADGVLRLLSKKLKISVTEVPSLLHRIQNQQRERLTTNNVIGEELIQSVQSVLSTLGNIKLDSFISNRLPLLNLPEEILVALRQGKLESSKAKAIAQLKDEKQRKELLSQAIAANLSLTEIKEQVKNCQQGEEPQSETQTQSLQLSKRVDEAYRRLRKAKIWDNPKKKKQVEKLLAQMEALMEER